MRKETLFITATDTAAGKTVTTVVLGILLKAQGYDVGVMKPVQCAGGDAKLLQKMLGVADAQGLINPFYAPEPLSPHLAFRRAKVEFNKNKILEAFKQLQQRHEIMLIEGAGGLRVPLTENYYNVDLIHDLKADVIIVSRRGLGTINHTLLTIDKAKAAGLKIKGIIFCDTKGGRKGLPEQSNPQEIEKLSGVKVLGIIPYLKPLTKANILRRCKTIKLDF